MGGGEDLLPGRTSSWQGCPELGGTAGWLGGADVPCTLCYRVGYSRPSCPCPALPVLRDFGARMSAVGHGLVPGGGCWGQVAEGPSPIPRSDAPPSPCRGLHQAQRKRILITFQRKQQLEKITASRLPASASVSQDERVPRLLVLLGGPLSLLSPLGHPFLQRGAARCHLPCHRGVPCALPVPLYPVPPSLSHGEMGGHRVPLLSEVRAPRWHFQAACPSGRGRG